MRSSFLIGFYGLILLAPVRAQSTHAVIPMVDAELFGLDRHLLILLQVSERRKDRRREWVTFLEIPKCCCLVLNKQLAA